MSPVIFDDINFERRAYDPWDAYAQSKTATALLAVQVWNELGSKGVTAHTLHPGGVQTGLLKHIKWDIGAQFAARYNYDVANSKVKTIEQGAATTIWAATEPALLHRETAYLEDCQVSKVLEKPIYSNGVMPYALDSRNAMQVWQAAEALIGSKMSLDPKK
jgi:NAD(P)-dependent dehydrogenase (short-subunit alcohol dehydrogenase family)